MISRLVSETKNYVIKQRRHFHANPEPSWKEVETSKHIKNELDKIDIPYISIAKTGIVATIEGGKPGKTVAIRADIDALAVSEETGLDFTSKNEGIMHACGHDGHAAMLLGAAKVLNQIKDTLPGTVKLFFQPAEEMVEGAKLMIEEGALDGVDGILGIHLWADIEIGKINCQGGPRMASGDYVLVDIEGKGGHGSMPNQGVDAALIAASFLTNIQMMVSREINPLDSAVLTFGEVKCGTRFNVLAGKAHIEGTSRCFDPEIRARFPEIITRYGESIAEAYRGSFKLEIREGCPPTINDDRCAAIGQSAVCSFLGKEALIPQEKTTGGEDMSYYLERIPGAIAFVGARPKGSDDFFPHHHPKFDIDEDSLAIGTELYVRFAVEFLEKF